MTDVSVAVSAILRDLQAFSRWYVVLTVMTALSWWVFGHWPFALWPLPVQALCWLWLGVTVLAPAGFAVVIPALVFLRDLAMNRLIRWFPSLGLAKPPAQIPGATQPP